MSAKRNFGSLLLIITAIIWGTAFAAQRSGMDLIEPITFTASRMVLAAAAVGCAALVMARKGARAAVERTPEEDKRYKKNTIAGGILCGVFLSTATIFQQIGLVYTTAGKAGFITAMYMLLVPVVNFIVFRKKNTWLVWTAVLTGVIGMYLLCVNEGLSLTRGDTLVCICAVLFTGHILCCDRFAARGDPIRISAIQFVTAAVISGAAAFIAEDPSWDKVISAAIPILYCGIVSGGIGYTLQIVAQRSTDPTVASLLLSLESVFAIIAGALILGERMSPRELVGCAVMFAAIILVQIPLPDKKKNVT
ncbi:MAG: DMT family transporter [Clostridia bacterium]|nr:DMT family transporter [Clostridia bacterium]